MRKVTSKLRGIDTREKYHHAHLKTEPASAAGGVSIKRSNIFIPFIFSQFNVHVYARSQPGSNCKSTRSRDRGHESRSPPCFLRSVLIPRRMSGIRARTARHVTPCRRPSRTCRAIPPCVYIYRVRRLCFSGAPRIQSTLHGAHAPFRQCMESHVRESTCRLSIPRYIFRTRAVFRARIRFRADGVYRVSLFFLPLAPFRSAVSPSVFFSLSLSLLVPTHLTLPAAVADKSVIKGHLADDWNFPEH